MDIEIITLIAILCGFIAIAKECKFILDWQRKVDNRLDKIDHRQDDYDIALKATVEWIGKQDKSIYEMIIGDRERVEQLRRSNPTRITLLMAYYNELVDKTSK